MRVCVCVSKRYRESERESESLRVSEYVVVDWCIFFLIKVDIPGNRSTGDQY